MVTGIQPVVPSVTQDALPATGTSGDATSSSSQTGFEAAGTTETFLQLLVAQIKNQNPLNPTDAVQFVSQLAQFSELEQTIGIRTDVQAIRQFAAESDNGTAPDTSVPAA